MKQNEHGLVRVRGAREHNLRDIDVDIPRDLMVAFTGISGSGKSSLAFGTLYAEAQRRYFESVAPYARRLLQQVPAPHVREILGLPPAVALRQRRGNPNSRSTVGTLTTLSNLLRLLFSRSGTYPPGTAHLEAESFSPNTVAGACPECHGLGSVHDVVEELLVPDSSLSVRQGAIAAWPGAWQGANLKSVTSGLGIDVDTPWRKLKKKDRDWLLFTTEQPSVLVAPEPGRTDWGYQGKFWSARSHVMHVLASSQSERMRERAMQFVRSVPCSVCAGSGLRPEALAVTFAGRSIAEMNATSLARLAPLLSRVGSAHTSDVAQQLCADMASRLQVLIDIGLGYLTLARRSTTLSPGEAQRLRIATELRSGLFGVVYVLDEPSAGLHPADTEALMGVLQRLLDSGNSLFIVEHDMDVVSKADWIVDLGPGAGDDGGRVLYSGPVAGLEAVSDSPTSAYLFGRRSSPARDAREPRSWLHLTGISLHNLHDVSFDLPLHVLSAVTGLSGSGKSTLVTQVLADTVRAHLGMALEGPGETGWALERSNTSGIEAIERLVIVDQRPIGRTPRSNLATYCGLFEHVRKIFAATPQAQALGWTASRFSFNVADGRCPTCRGEGFVRVELMFLPESYSPCPECGGTRYEVQTLEVTYGGVNIAEVLAMTVLEASLFFADNSAILQSLRTLADVGLGYLRLGQPATDLSGGEAQRIKLASELQRVRSGQCLYVLDEPTAGLHPHDVALLVNQLERLVELGHTVVIVEHDLDTIARADWVIDLGPGGGDEGGRIVASGPPERIAATEGNVTGRYLAAHLAPARRRPRRTP